MQCSSWHNGPFCLDFELDSAISGFELVQTLVARASGLLTFSLLLRFRRCFEVLPSPYFGLEELIELHIGRHLVVQTRRVSQSSLTAGGKQRSVG